VFTQPDRRARSKDGPRSDLPRCIKYRWQPWARHLTSRVAGFRRLQGDSINIPQQCSSDACDLIRCPGRWVLDLKLERIGHEDWERRTGQVLKTAGWVQRATDDISLQKAEGRRKEFERIFGGGGWLPIPTIMSESTNQSPWMTHGRQSASQKRLSPVDTKVDANRADPTTPERED
jgi:hypothetical protein